MSIKVYNTLTRKKEDFQPIEKDRVKMYVCGPTVYSDCHIGHIMGPVLFDAVARWFTASGYEVQFVNNITDIDDKIINKSIATGEDWNSIAVRYTDQYFGLLEQLNVNTVTEHPKCSEYIPQMITYIQDLIDDDRAYPATDGVYYDVSKQPNYGKLSGRCLDDMMEGARVDAQSGLRNSADFCLWKLAKDGEPSWESPWGNGRPGWHIECSVMASEMLGDTFDIHGGGDDLKFPHHENEIAQSEAHGGDYAKCWMHNGLIQYEGKKVGKSDPRMKDPDFAIQFDANYLMENHGPDCLRLLLLRGHYRRPVDFAPGEFTSTTTTLKRLQKTIRAEVPAGQSMTFAEVKAVTDNEEVQELITKFSDAMNDDFNTGVAIGHIFSMVSLSKSAADQERTSILTVADQLLKVLGLDLGEVEEAKASDETLDKVMSIMIDIRQKAREEKNWAVADLIRDRLGEAGLEIQDSPEGSIWKFKED